MHRYVSQLSCTWLSVVILFFTCQHHTAFVFLFPLHTFFVGLRVLVPALRLVLRSTAKSFTMFLGPS